jgi:hypothetical protein
VKIDIDIPDGTSGDWSIKTFEVSEEDTSFYNVRAVFKPGCRTIEPGTYKKLIFKKNTTMSNTPAEIEDHMDFIYKARNGGHILINGLGLGVALKAILENDNIESITVVEISEDVIKLVAPYYEKDKRVNIIHADAFTWKPPKGIRYSAVWHDIWNNITSENLPEMTRLHRKYGRRTDWQGSWCKDLCIRYR